MMKIHVIVMNVHMRRACLGLSVPNSVELELEEMYLTISQDHLFLGVKNLLWLRKLKSKSTKPSNPSKLSYRVVFFLYVSVKISVSLV